MKIAFLHFAEPYHCYHAASVASALAAFPDCDVTEFVNFDVCQPHLARIRRLLGAPPLPQEEFIKSWPTRLLEKTRLLDAQRLRLLRENVARLDAFDAVVATEYTAALLKKAGLRAKLIYISHGAGDRKVGDEDLIRHFDLALLPGPKMATYLCAQGWLTPEKTRLVGAPKFDIFHAIQTRASENDQAPFEGKPYVLYNPHYKKSFNDWTRVLPALVDGFKAQDAYGLMVAPHVKMFHEGWGGAARKLRRLEGGAVKVDTGSPAMQDMTYTATASLYVGDISSQFYEFLAMPRPCVFVNPRKLAWRGNPFFRNWTLGDVVEDPRDLMSALRAAPTRHAHYHDAQRALLHETYGDQPLPGAGARGAEALRAYLMEQP